MKNKKVIIFSGIIITIALVLSLIIFRQEQRRINGYQSQITNNNNSGNLKKLVPKTKSGEYVLKNKSGLFARQIQETLIQGEYSSMYTMLNQDVLEQYGYTVNQEKYLNYWSSMGQPFKNQDMKVIIFKASKTRVNNGILASYCVANKRLESVEKDCYDYENCRWLDITLYFDEKGNVDSILPCPESAIDNYAKTLGFEKKGR